MDARSEETRFLASFMCISLSTLLLIMALWLNASFIVVVLRRIFTVKEDYISLVVFASQLLKLVTLYMLSILADTKATFTRPRYMLIEAAVATIVTNILLLYAGTAFIFSAIWVLQAIPLAVVTVVAYAEILDLLKSKTYLFGLFRGITSSTYVLSPLVAGIAMQFYGLKGLIFMATLLSIAALVSSIIYT